MEILDNMCKLIPNGIFNRKESLHSDNIFTDFLQSVNDEKQSCIKVFTSKLGQPFDKIIHPLTKSSLAIAYPVYSHEEMSEMFGVSKDVIRRGVKELKKLNLIVDKPKGRTQGTLFDSRVPEHVFNNLVASTVVEQLSDDDIINLLSEKLINKISDKVTKKVLDKIGMGHAELKPVETYSDCHVAQV